jgi:hypothetical protein
MPTITIAAPTGAFQDNDSFNTMIPSATPTTGVT